MLGLIPNNYFHLEEQKKNEARAREVDERERAAVL
jgi:hypothetical protein